MEPVKILICTANAFHSRRILQIEDELRSIEGALQRARLRERYVLRISLSVSFTRVVHEIDDHEPAIVHFSGHGDPSGTIILRDDKGGERHIKPSRIAGLLGIVPCPPTLVTFATSYSAELAKAVVEYADYAIGFDGPFNDASAPLFSAMLYERLASRPEFDVQRALRLAKVACLAEDHRSVELVRLYKRHRRTAETMHPASMLTARKPSSGRRSGSERYNAQAMAPALDPALRPLVDELARVFWESEYAEVFILRSGLAPQRMPKFNTPRTFWEKVAMEAERGAIPGGVRALGKVAAADYPGNKIFARYR